MFFVFCEANVARFAQKAFSATCQQAAEKYLWHKLQPVLASD
jgi:hypothetical protein